MTPNVRCGTDVPYVAKRSRHVGAPASCRLVGVDTSIRSMARGRLSWRPLALSSHIELTVRRARTKRPIIRIKVTRRAVVVSLSAIRIRRRIRLYVSAVAASIPR